MKLTHIHNSKRDLSAYISRSKHRLLKNNNISPEYTKFFSHVEKTFINLINENKLKSREEIMRFTMKVCIRMNIVRWKRKRQRIKNNKEKLNIETV